MKRILKNKKIAVPMIVIGTFLLVVFNVYFYMNRSNINTDYYGIKESNNFIVYTRYTRTYKEITTIVPYINLRSSIIGDLNQEIADMANNYLRNDNNVITYDYKISGDILSVVIQINCYDDYLPKVIFRTYNINLEDKRLLEDQEILDLYGINTEHVASKIRERFEYFFRDEREKKIFDEECDFKCFLYMRGVDNYTDNIYYYVDNSKLYVYKEFNIYSIYKEEKYFENSDFKIEII